MQFSSDHKNYWSALVQPDNEANDFTAGRYEYDEDRIISLCSLEGSAIVLTSESSYTFIENIVAMNKHLHQCLFPDAGGKWFFTRADLDSGCNARERIELRFKHNMNYRLTRSDILVNGKKLGDLYFSLVKT
ncbi:MAG: hypothetical protein L0Y38_01885 [Methylococcaceae bacterium]|nr:hypothetical protein [Methylococcaceae bacterium]